ncbi:hypothetical protein [Mucilaginibacter auburnensis]|uniref:Uncharacterized protein n=1 Tax=Mucilaginibacter auburnensis TaxID=1457233 RepID=A0A2H9VU25_9SPHI|nr:hypothetical protein [Mucilaginibacter auburnensis]PJJ84333.1 hypothetical protein CLV57_1344 [Mucilaginibacter auburnensis]
MNYENQNSGNGNRPEERPERRQSEQEGSGYSPQREQQQQDSGNDASFSEQNDVTPPNEHEFPSEGPSRADFQPQHHSRSTGRMVGHEPGTESI